MATKKSDPRSEASQAAAEAVRDFVVDKAAEALNQKTAELDRKLTAKAVRQQQKIAEKAARHIEHLDRLSSQLETLDIWTRIEPGSRRPRFTREQIAAAAVRIADAEGSDALSMRRIAAELDAGTMTLYHYVRTKDELLSLVTDAVMGEVVLPPDEALPDNWRAAVTVIANRSREVLERHPWMFDITDDPAIGPNSVRHFDQTLQAVSSLPIDLEGKLELVAAIDEYVFGYCLHQRNNVHAGSDVDEGMVDYVLGLLDTGEYPALTELSTGAGLAEAWTQIEGCMRDRSRFDRSLDRLLDGFEAHFQAHRR